MIKFDKSVIINVKLEESDKNELAKLAKAEERPLSNYCRYVLMQHLHAMQAKESY